MMNRAIAFDRLRTRSTPWDLLVVGGGATGLGVALDAATRGYAVLLVERDDFAAATSSRSTKLLHGGVRYLRQGNIRLVREALAERGRVLANAPHLASPLPFVIPAYRLGERLMLGAGLAVYERLAGRASLGRSRILDAAGTRAALPGLRGDGLRGGVRYLDGQFDDARLALGLAQSAWDHGATVLNYTELTALTQRGGTVNGGVVRDLETGESFELAARVVVNATGVFSDSIRQLARPNAEPTVEPSRGTHLVLPRRFLPGDTALMIPKTDDGRVLFAIPWQGRLLLGTTDVAVPEATAEPMAQADEIAYLLHHIARYLDPAPSATDILAVFSGLRPLVRQSGAQGTSALARDHLLHHEAGLVSITGGKWTTYREMAEQTVDLAAQLAGLPARASVTASLPLHGATASPAPVDDPLARYGSDAPALRALAAADPDLAAPLHPALPLTGAEVIWAARHEMARTAVDVLARRARATILDAGASLDIAPAVARLLAHELGHDEAWIAQQTTACQRHIRTCCLPAAA
ncbi:MAG TPA: glycerol-3-phosphate dehydrogenase/oxidase [Thiobacillus sp.]|nr:glycerol-3-phosphate dehydrogenase/oxidase [Thiobacillus sp.]